MVICRKFIDVAAFLNISDEFHAIDASTPVLQVNSAPRKTVRCAAMASPGVPSPPVAGRHPIWEIDEDV